MTDELSAFERRDVPVNIGSYLITLIALTFYFNSVNYILKIASHLFMSMNFFAMHNFVFFFNPFMTF
jgi:hypothetical protein